MSLLLVALCAFATPPEEVVAVVNGMEITRAEYEAAAARKSPADGERLSSDEKREVVDGLVEEKILYLEALRLGLDRDPKVQKVMVNTLLREQVYANVRNADFSEAELEAYFEAHRGEFVVPEKVQIKRILVTVSEARSEGAARAEAERIRAEVTLDTFSDAAGRYSEDPYRRRGGDVGFVSREGKPGLDPAVVDRAFALELDAISEVFRGDDGFNVITVASRRERVDRTYEQMKGSVLRKVKNERMKALYDTYVAERRGGVKVKVDQRALDAIEVAPRPGLQPPAPDDEELPEPR